ncbi:unnamed protein product [Leuciscus chuanchicus]
MAAVSETDVQFWMAKAVSWGEATSCSALLDTSRHLDYLRSFLQQVLLGLQQMRPFAPAVLPLVLHIVPFGAWHNRFSHSLLGTAGKGRIHGPVNGFLPKPGTVGCPLAMRPCSRGD